MLSGGASEDVVRDDADARPATCPEGHLLPVPLGLGSVLGVEGEILEVDRGEIVLVVVVGRIEHPMVAEFLAVVIKHLLDERRPGFGCTYVDIDPVGNAFRGLHVSRPLPGVLRSGVAAPTRGHASTSALRYCTQTRR